MARRRRSAYRLPPAMPGALTRRQSEDLVHRTRSGRVRLYPVSHLNDLALANPPSNPSDRPLAGNVCCSESISVKDLRSHRVFSPASTSFDNSINDQICVAGKEVVGDVGDRSDGLEDGLIRSTAPDSEFSDKSSISKDGVGGAVRVSGEEGARRPLLRSRNQPNKRLGLVPCSRLKLYGNPNSFSYKRLLPFLMEMDNSNDVKPFIAPDYPIKNPPSHKENSFTEGKHEVQGIGESLNTQMSFNSNASERHVSENHNLRTLNVADHKPTRLSALIDERQGEINDMKPRATREGGSFELELMVRSFHLPPDRLQVLAIKELHGSAQALAGLTKKVEEDCQKVISYMDKIPLADTSSHGGRFPVGQNVLAPKHGILKSQAGGCRGPCPCLDCTTFLIHAEKAFEFSKKQMHGADDIIVGLTKELSHLRSLVEKSVVKVEDKKYNSGLQPNEMKEACRRALKAEETARSLLSQMFNDLNEHCRIPGRRVTFAECIEQNNQQ
ncbi:uncharacterized protein LOC120257095 isoform X2 [Dioscorea cayenensis subsp. rotundata]|uniref:Uncharacterized protein LOC120257095 isoform X2 n=1 Tax=Dioscorea cayennensis subsp. rotundata TaxID=55577 RepID=A0AB40B1M3_DIOCR|nr:uncharacterized protein LOC120257095 isoform X2 [Dioscorea cayenensis subsp. rotundata]